MGTEQKNKSGLLGGLGFLGEKIGAGAMSTIEGIWDYAAGGLADLFGADEWAEDQIANDWFGDWYTNAGEWFNPGEGWSVAGDIAGGIGTSLPTIAANFIPVVGTAVGMGVAGLGAAGNATKEAYRKSGELTGKEWGYGALVGITEGALEGVTGAVGAGTARIGKELSESIFKRGAKEATEQAAKQAVKGGVRQILGTIAKNAGKDFLGEAFEEGMSEILSPFYARMTFDPEAENASLEQVLYSAFIGGMSGVIMGGAQSTVSSYFGYRDNLATGKNVLSGGYAGEILATAKHMTETMAKDASYAGYKVLHSISDTYKKLAASLEKTGGEIQNARQKAQLGALNRMEAATRILPYIEESAGRILSNPMAAVERFKSMNLVDADGNPLSITAEALTKGLEGKDLRDLRRALSNNPTIATLAIADATGKLMLGAEGFTTAVKAGTDVRRADYHNFLETASAAAKQEVASRLGLSGSLDAVSFEEFLSAARQYATTEEGRATFEKARTLRQQSSEGRRYALPEDIDAVDFSQYNEIKLSGDEMSRLQSHATTWGPLKRNMIRHQTLGDTSYTYYMDSDGIVHCLDKEPSTNIHERREIYDIRDRERPDRYAEKFGTGQGYDRIHSDVSQDGRESTEAFADDVGSVSGEGRSDRAGRGEDAAPSYRKKKRAVGYHFGEDGTNTITYSDGTTERMAPARKDALSENGGTSDGGRAVTTAERSTVQNSEEIDSWAQENVKGYRELLPNERREIRALVRQGRALGISDADIAAYASVSSRSGVKISFSKDRVAIKKDGKLAYSDGFYDPATGEIVINPEGKRSAGKLLMHELSHALYGNKRFAKALDSAVRNMNADRAEKILDAYRKAGRTNLSELSEELAVHHAEDVLGNRENLARLLRDEPTMGDKILSFFGLARDAYTGRLSREAGRLYRHFETALKELSAEHRGNLASDTLTRTKNEKTQVSGKGRRDAIGTYTEKEYNDYGWVRENNILTAGENAHYRSQFADADKLDFKYRMTSRGEYMIPVSDIYDPVWEGVERKIVYAKGKIDSPVITRVLEMDLYNETELDETRREVYEIEWRGIQQETGGVFNVYHSSDFTGARPSQGMVPKSPGYYNQLRAERRAGGGRPERVALFVRGAENAHVPVREEFTDVSGINRAVVEFKKGEYTVWGSRVRKPSPSIEQAIYAENKNIINGYARRYDRTPTWVIQKLRQDPTFLIEARNTNKKFALPEEEFTSSTLDSVGKEKRRYEPKLGDRIFTAKTRAYIETVDELHGIEVYLRKAGGRKRADAEARVQVARTARSQAQTMIGSLQYDVFSDNPKELGDGLLEILKPTRNWSDKKHLELNDYLLHRLNIDRMTVEGRAKVWAAAESKKIEVGERELTALRKAAKKGKADPETVKAKERELKTLVARAEGIAALKNKPVFGKQEGVRDAAVTAEESRKTVAEYEKKHPDFAKIAEKLYTYLDNLQAMRVEAGLITRESADFMKKLYPHYVPSYRDTEGHGIAPIKGDKTLSVSSTIRGAKGGGEDILDIANSIAAQTDELMRAGHINMLAGEIYDAAKASGDTTYVEILSEESVDGEEAATDAVLRPKEGQITFYRDGKRITMKVSREILLGFDGLRKPTLDLSNPFMRASAWLNKQFKRGVTSLNPAFMLRNPIRDLQDAGLNSKHPALFAKKLPTAAMRILKNSENYQLFRAMGGYASTVFDGALADRVGYAGFESIAALFSETDARGLKRAWKKLSAPAKALLTGVENANVLLEQMTRFAEFEASLEAGDSVAVALNNSAEVTTNFGRRGRLTKVANATIMPFLNPAVQGFDKMFRNVGDAFTGGHMVRGLSTLIAKAAVIGVAPMLLNALMYDDDEDYEKLRETDKENNFLIKTGDGTFIKIPRGRVASVIGGLYNRGSKLAKGEDAELDGYLENVVSQVTPVENVSRTIFSPLFDVANNKTWYGGEIEGREFEDTAPKNRYDESTSSIAIALGKVFNYSPKKIHYLLDQYSGVVGDFVLPATSGKEHKDFFSGNFTLDSVTNNKYSEKFYALYDKTQYAETAGDEAAAYRLKYLNRVKKSVRELNREIDEIRNGDGTNAEKLQEVRVVRALINAAYDSALKSVGTVDKAIEATKGIEDETLRDAEITRMVFGSESAIKNYSATVHDKLSRLYAVGVEWDELYVYYFAMRGLTGDKDKNGNTIQGSLKRKILSVVNALDVTPEQKILLLAEKGYVARTGDIPGVSEAKAKAILKKHGYVKNK